MMGFKGPLASLSEPATNIAYGTQYLAEAWRLANQDICTTVMKYRAGHAETRFSVKSVDYCKRVRRHLATIGYPVTGEVPKPTFGFSEGGGAGRSASRDASGSGSAAANASPGSCNRGAISAAAFRAPFSGRRAC